MKNNVWKAKKGGGIPYDIIKNSDLNKDYIDKEDGKLIVKKSKNSSGSITVNPPLHKKDDGSLELLYSDEFGIEENQLSFKSKF